MNKCKIILFTRRKRYWFVGIYDVDRKICESSCETVFADTVGMRVYDRRIRIVERSELNGLLID